MAEKGIQLRISILKRIALLFTLSLIVSSLLTVAIQYVFTLNEIREEGTIAAEAIGSTVKTAIDYEGSLDKLREDEEYRVRTHDVLRELCTGFKARFISLYTIDEDENRHNILIAAGDQSDDQRMNKDYGYDSGNVNSVPLNDSEKNVLRGIKPKDSEIIKAKMATRNQQKQNEYNAHNEEQF